MTKEVFRSKEDLNELNEFNKQAKQDLKNLQQEAIQPCINYLKLVVDKSYEEYTDMYSKDTITSLQHLLQNRWYDVGKIDGILATKWSKTSRTMEAIKRFQRDYHMKKVNGLPDKDTIKTLLLLYEIDNDKKKEEINRNKKRTKAGYLLEMNWVSFLTDKEAKNISSLGYVELNRVTSISDKVAKILWSWHISSMELNWLTKISDMQTKYLLWTVSRLWLNWLTGLTDVQALLLSKLETLSLNWLKRFTTKDQIRYLLSWNITNLSLDWLTNIDGIEKDLSNVEILSLNWLKRFTTKDQAKNLLSWNVKNLFLSWLKSIDGVEKDLSNVEILELNWLTSLTNKQVELLTSWKIKYLYLHWLKSITDEQAKMFVNSKSSLEILGINKWILTPTQRKILKNKVWFYQ